MAASQLNPQRFDRLQVNLIPRRSQIREIRHMRHYRRQIHPRNLLPKPQNIPPGKGLYLHPLGFLVNNWNEVQPKLTALSTAKSIDPAIETCTPTLNIEYPQLTLLPFRHR
ncbi:MAG: hypothetical protein QXE79_06575 [Candidatus Bathyarchaeia archaeon]